ncbi:biliverdin-producing heme oxygenase [Dokdonia sp. Hel_I_53]|uniref:biliverdin-producing heme oxygenase n=1 Tax=Dokdonia sp. Hel_I_53 TaxID=1566287 RepID=UPI001198F8F4|nr:biliverdin-producing heme oxygenase [Dokdonia sp. Hel_I_53]TVZ53328.1 heme oxygenase [Dokdonia sp. Hel_I_53]
MILEKLKADTFEIHKEVEKDNLAKFIMDESITQTQYEILLRQNFKVYKAVEDFVNSHYDILPQELKAFTGYEKTNRLAKDINSFSNLPLPQPYKIASNRDLATVIGLLYVIEGSMLGGMMMSKKIQSCAHLSHIDTHHFYHSNVKESAARWKNFKAVLTSITFSDQESENAVASAMKTFSLFQESYKSKNI